MTATKPLSSSSSSAKVSPKRAVSFCGLKYEAPKKQQAPSDKLLQCVDKRRRYMRRGSRSPSMLKFCAKIDYLEEECNEKIQQPMTPQQRRMSLMSALKLSLEQTAIDPKKSKLHSIGEEKTFSTFELLSQVCEST